MVAAAPAHAQWVLIQMPIRIFSNSLQIQEAVKKFRERRRNKINKALAVSSNSPENKSLLYDRVLRVGSQFLDS